MSVNANDSTEIGPDVEILDEARIQAIPFAVTLPKSTIQDFDGPELKTSSISVVGDNAVVGSIVVLKKSVMVWVGWGNIDPYQTQDAGSLKSTGSFGKGIPSMGQVVVAMPRTNYKGAFGTGAKEPSCSQIVGSASSEDQMLGSQMASRLSTRSGMAVLVSCQLSSIGDNQEAWTSGMNSEMISHRAAALAEKEVWRILKDIVAEQES